MKNKDHPPSYAQLRRIRGAKSFKNGLEAEILASTFLQKSGFTLLAHRSRTPYGEIDLIIADRDWLIGVEVKKRKTHYDSAFALGSRQAKRLLEAFNYLMTAHPEWQRINTRFDVILVDDSGEIELLQDALRLF